MKKIFGFIVVASIAAALVGCGAKDEAQVKAPAPAPAAGGAPSTPGAAGASDASKSGVEEVKVGQAGTR